MTLLMVLSDSLLESRQLLDYINAMADVEARIVLLRVSPSGREATLETSHRVLEQARHALSGGRGEVGTAVTGAEAPPHKQLTEAWIARAKAGGHLNRAGLVEDVVRFLLERTFYYVVEQPRLLLGLQSALLERLDTLRGENALST